MESKGTLTLSYEEVQELRLKAAKFEFIQFLCKPDLTSDEAGQLVEQTSTEVPPHHNQFKPYPAITEYHFPAPNTLQGSYERRRRNSILFYFIETLCSPDLSQEHIKVLHEELPLLKAALPADYTEANQQSFHFELSPEKSDEIIINAFTKPDDQLSLFELNYKDFMLKMIAKDPFRKLAIERTLAKAGHRLDIAPIAS